MQIKIEEDGSSNPPVLPPGTIIRSMIGPDGQTYYLVRLDHPIRSHHVRLGNDWILHNLAIAPYLEGGAIEQIASSKVSQISVGITNMFVIPEEDEPVLDFSKGEYFAVGTVRRFES